MQTASCALAGTQISVPADSKDFNMSAQTHGSSFFWDYDPLVRPVSHPSDAVEVRVMFTMVSLLDVDIRKQTVSSFGWLTATWVDGRLSEILTALEKNEVLVDSDQIWKPDIAVYNSVDDTDLLQKLKMRLGVERNGRVTWRPGNAMKTFCSMDITYYPFDIHHCSIDIATWVYTEKDVMMIPVEPLLDVTDLMDSSEWTVSPEAVTSYYVLPDYKVLQFNFRLKRKVLFFVTNVLLPILLASVLSCVVMVLPNGSGEKMTVSLTSFLAFITYLKVTMDTLPRNSDTVCFFSLYLALQLVISVVNITVSTVAVKLYFEERQHIMDSVVKQSISGCSTSTLDIPSSRRNSETAEGFNLAKSQEIQQPAQDNDSKENNDMEKETIFRIRLAKSSPTCRDGNLTDLRRTEEIVDNAQGGEDVNARVNGATMISSKIERYGFVASLLLNILSGGLFLVAIAVGSRNM
nr:hypothetical protein BaRGS_003833 [Batillaria attramentaria]